MPIVHLSQPVLGIAAAHSRVRDSSILSAATGHCSSDETQLASGDLNRSASGEAMIVALDVPRSVRQARTNAGFDSLHCDRLATVPRMGHEAAKLVG